MTTTTTTTTISITTVTTILSSLGKYISHMGELGKSKMRDQFYLFVCLSREVPRDQVFIWVRINQIQCAWH